MLRTILTLFPLLTLLSFEHSAAYSAYEDARIIANYKRQILVRQQNHAKVARSLVHQASWASVGTISTDPNILGYPMVNVISINDNNANGTSTGKIRFLLTDLDFTGPDWKNSNKVSFLFTDDQNQNCKERGVDPMEPTCARAILSGSVHEMDKTSKDYNDALTAFRKRHPASNNWIKAHTFYLCELNIKHIYVLDAYGGPHDVPVDQYYSTAPDNTTQEYDNIIGKQKASHRGILLHH